MSKSSKAKVKKLFRIKSPEKENKEFFRDGAPASPGDKSEPPSPGAFSLGDTLPGKEKKSKKLFLFKLKLKKSRSKTEEDDVDFPDTISELSSFSSLR